MKDFAMILLVGLAICCGLIYLYKASQAKKGLTWKILLSILGVVLYLLIFFAINTMIDKNMPKWFLQFINENGDAAGASLVIIFSAVVNSIIPIIFIRNKESA